MTAQELGRAMRAVLPDTSWWHLFDLHHLHRYRIIHAAAEGFNDMRREPRAWRAALKERLGIRVNGRR